MAIYTNLPVYEDSYRLMLEFSRISIRMQRDYRYTLGEDVKRMLMAIILDIYRANYSCGKAAADNVTDARERMVEVNVILRMLNEMRQIPDRHYAMLIETAVSISRQLAGWERSLRRNRKSKGLDDGITRSEPEYPMFTDIDSER